ncbi:hypothetical protein Dimus_012928 [Dionaea muscipula]
MEIKGEATALSPMPTTTQSTTTTQLPVVGCLAADDTSTTDCPDLPRLPLQPPLPRLSSAASGWSTVASSAPPQPSMVSAVDASTTVVHSSSSLRSPDLSSIASGGLGLSGGGVGGDDGRRGDDAHVARYGLSISSNPRAKKLC